MPDVRLTLEDPRTDVFETPPLVVIEILSQSDEMSEALEKLEEVGAGGFSAESPEVRLPPAEVFRGL